ncbi:uncharacterized protein LOC17888906 isoform X2 [Capsella rubella]|uniref:uncharacterized protein LOC17888906 isoform X2 n=1 Tax=Capsella rubella TaxID=81985 RepID=UPI000CD590E6|nr:uncharacterized protein LOC17888906 isoform X2 [Capsella rubella]
MHITCSTKFPNAQNWVFFFLFFLPSFVTWLSRDKLLYSLMSPLQLCFFSQHTYLSETERERDQENARTLKIVAMMNATTYLRDAESVALHKKAKDLLANGDHIKALEIIQDMIEDHKEDEGIWFLHAEEGYMFMKLSEIAVDYEMDFTSVLASVACFSEHEKLLGALAHAIYTLAQIMGSVRYYKKSVKIAKQTLSVSKQKEDSASSSGAQMSLQWKMNLAKTKEDLENLIEDSESKISASKTGRLKGLIGKERESENLESKNSPEPPQDRFKGLRSFWLGLDVKAKRDFMKVSIAKLRSFVEGVHDEKGQDTLEKLLDSAKEDRKWTFWICRERCSKKFSSAEECKNHFEQEHAADFVPSKEMDMVKRIGKDWARRISIGGWEPVDTVAAVEMIKNRLADVKAFSYKNGWSKEWPLAVDEERSKLLKEIKISLVKFCDLKILPCSVRDCVMQYPLKYLGKLEVSKQSLVDSHLVETPQSICFLDCHELSQILNFLKRIKCEREDGIDIVCRTVNNALGSTQVTEKIDFDPEFSFLLLDRRLLNSNNPPFDDDGTINVFDPSVHYAKAHAQGDDIISWLTDYNTVERIFPKPIREHNLDIWVAVLRAVQFTCKTLGTKYAKKMQLFHYYVALTVVEDLCMSEDARRRNLREYQWNSYASLLCDRCEEGVPGNSLNTELFVYAVRDVLEGALEIFDFPDFEECVNLICERKCVSDDIVLKSIHSLKSVANSKVILIDSKILLVDNSRISLLNDLTRLSVFDNRIYIRQLLQPFLLNEIMDMESKAKLDAAGAAEADLLFEEEKKSQSKKKKNKSKKQRTSTTISSPLKTGEDKPPVNLEPKSTSPSLKTVVEDFVEPDDASERRQSEISSNTINQEDVMQNLLGEDSQSEHSESALGEAASRYSSALDMTLKALLNIKMLKEDLMQNKQPFQDHLEEHVPPALKQFFTAFVSEEINSEGVYSCLLSDFLVSLEEFISMVSVEQSSDAAEVLVAIIESWQCWKNAEKESLVTRLFTLEENERMSCRKCRKKLNYPEQSSNGIVLAADSIRDLKCALGDVEFVDICKVIRMEYKMLCDIKTGGCGITNFVHHIISKCPPIFTIVLVWEKSETETEISETTKALDWEIDFSRMYEGLEPNTNYRLVSLVGCGEEEEHICLAYVKNRWVNLRRDALKAESVGSWKSVVRFCGERKVRPEILFYEAATKSMAY